MTPQDFCYWLQGYYEMVGTYKLSDEQQKMVFEHHQLAFNKVTPTSIKEKETTTQQSKDYWLDPFGDIKGMPKFDKICSTSIKKDVAPIKDIFFSKEIAPGFTFVGKDVLSCGTSTNTNSNTTTNSGLIVNQYYKVNRTLYAYSDPHGGSKTGIRIDDPFLLLGQRPVWYGEAEPSYKIHMLYNGNELHTEIQTRDLNDFSIVTEPMISPWQDKVIEPHHYADPTIKTLYGATGEHIIKLIREQDYLNKDHRTSPESLKTDQYCILDLRGWARDAAGQLVGPIISGSFTIPPKITSNKVLLNEMYYKRDKVFYAYDKSSYDTGLVEINGPFLLLNQKIITHGIDGIFKTYAIDILYNGKRLHTEIDEKDINSFEPTINTYDYRDFIGTCPLMHPTCSRNHYSSDPNNTPEEYKKLLEWENSRMFHTSSQSQIKCEYEEKHGYRCVNHKHLDKIASEGSEKSMFDNAIKITPGSEQYYRNIKCNMTC